MGKNKNRKGGGYSRQNGGTGDVKAESRIHAWPPNPPSTSNDSLDNLNMYNRGAEGDEELHHLSNAQPTSYGPSRPSQHSSHYASDDHHDHRRSASPSRMDYRYDSRIDRDYGADRSAWRANESQHTSQRPVPDSYYPPDTYARRDDQYYRDSGSSSRAPQTYDQPDVWAPPVDSSTSRYSADERRDWRGREREQSSYPSHQPAYDTWDRDDRYAQPRPSDDRYPNPETRSEHYSYSRSVDDRYSHSQTPDTGWPTSRRDNRYDDGYTRNPPENNRSSWPARDRERDDSYARRSQQAHWDRREEKSAAPNDSSWEPAPGWRERESNPARDDASHLATKKKKKNKKQRDKNKEKRRETEDGSRDRDRGEDDDRGRGREPSRHEKPYNGSKWSDDETDHQSRKRRMSVSPSPTRGRYPAESPTPHVSKRPRLTTPEHQRVDDGRSTRSDRARSAARSPLLPPSKDRSRRESDVSVKRRQTPSSPSRSLSRSRSPSTSPSHASPKPRSPKPMHRLNGALPVKITPALARNIPTGPRQPQTSTDTAVDLAIPKGPRGNVSTGRAGPTGGSLSASSALRRFFPGEDDEMEAAVPTAPKAQGGLEPPRGPRENNGYSQSDLAGPPSAMGDGTDEGDRHSEPRPRSAEEERLQRGGWSLVRPGITEAARTNGASRTSKEHHDNQRQDERIRDDRRQDDRRQDGRRQDDRRQDDRQHDDRQHDDRRQDDRRQDDREHDDRRHDDRRQGSQPAPGYDDRRPHDEARAGYAGGSRRSPREKPTKRYPSEARSPPRVRARDYDDHYTDRQRSRYQYRDEPDRRALEQPSRSREVYVDSEAERDDKIDRRSTSVTRGSRPVGRTGRDEREQSEVVPPAYTRPRDPTISYQIGNAVGEGTFGKVYKASDPTTGFAVALKRIRMEGEKDGFPVTAMREIKILQSLRHPNIVRLYEMMLSKGSVYMVFEYMEHDLLGVLSQSLFSFSDANLKSFSKQMMDGLAYLHHRGILHRDLKGSNILVNKRGELKLADFGLARFYNKRRRLDYTNRVITLWYRPPELLLGATEYAGEVDVWSAGCIIVELFTRAAPFRGDGELEEIAAIFKLKGTPSLEDWPELTELPWYEMLRPKQPLPDRFEETMRESLQMPGLMDLAQRMLTYNPLKRLTAAEALNHPYFTSELPAPEQPIQMLTVEGDWHELETKPLRDIARQKDKERKAAAAAVVVAESGNISA